MQSNRNPFLKSFFDYILYLESLYWEGEEYKRKKKRLHKLMNKLIEEGVTSENALALRAALKMSLIPDIKNKADEAKRKKINADNQGTVEVLEDLHLQYLKPLMANALPIKEKKAENKNILRVIGAFFLKLGKDLIQSIAGATDDIANAMKNILGNISPFVLGGAAGIAHALNIKEGAEDIASAFKEQTKAQEEADRLARHHVVHEHHVVQYKTRLTTGSLTIGTSLAGIAMSAAYIASFAGAAVAGGPVFPVVIFGLLMVKASISLWRNSSILHQAKIDEAAAKKARDDVMREIIDLQKELLKKIPDNLLEHDKNKELSVDDPKSFSNLDKERKTLLLRTLTKKTQELESKESHYQACVEKRLEAENEIGFSTAELILAGVVVVGTILGTVAILGAASVASFGIAPIAIGAAAAGIAIAVKLYKVGDDHFHWTERMKSFCKRKWNNWFPSKAEEAFELKNIITSTSTIVEALAVAGPVGDPLLSEQPEQAEGLGVAPVVHHPIGNVAAHEDVAALALTRSAEDSLLSEQSEQTEDLGSSQVKVVNNPIKKIGNVAAPKDHLQAPHQDDSTETPVDTLVQSPANFFQQVANTEIVESKEKQQLDQEREQPIQEKEEQQRKGGFLAAKEELVDRHRDRHSFGN